jgi:hypothetical protein
MIQNQSLMMHNMTMMATATIKQQEKEDRKKLMMSKLITQDENLFELLTAESWYDDVQGKSEFTTRVMADKDITVAWRMIERTTMSWPGLISQKQVAKFFKSGFIASNIRECPGVHSLHASTFQVSSGKITQRGIQFNEVPPR